MGRLVSYLSVGITDLRGRFRLKKLPHPPGPDVFREGESLHERDKYDSGEPTNQQAMK